MSIEPIHPERASRLERTSIGACLLSAALVAMAGCSRGTNGEGSATSANGAMPPAQVGVVTIAPERAVTTLELPGRSTPVRTAEVRARATGILLKQSFQEGAQVEAGQVLFEIDPAPLQAAYDGAKAALAKAEATREQTAADAKRKATLVKINGVSRQAYEEAVATARQSEADVLSTQAALATAALNLGYTKVTAPISGRIGKALVTEGALASAGEATEIAVIKQLDPIYVDFTQSSVEMLRLRRLLEAGKLQGVAQSEVKISLMLEDGTVYGKTGRLVFSDISVGEQTGTVTLRGEFPNSQQVLLPGMFVRGRIDVGVEAQAITVPVRAVSRDSYGDASVLVVNAENRVEQRAIQTSSLSGNKWIVSSGLSAGDRVIVAGLQNTRAGATVQPVPFQATTEATAPANR